MEFQETDFIITNNSPKSDYQIIVNELHKRESNEKLSFILSFIQYLTYYYNENSKDIIFMGEITNSQIEIILKLFKNLNFYIYNSKNPFTDEEANKWNGKNVMFYSNYRSVPNKDLTSIEIENLNYNDLKIVQKWLFLIKPSSASIRFRLPFSNNGYNSIEYYKGIMCKKIYNGINSTEIRLLITDFNSSVKLDIITYEQILTYFNRVTREETLYKDPFFDNKFLNYDNIAEYFVYINYLYKFEQKINYENVIKMKKIINNYL